MQKGVVIDSSTMADLANPNGTPEAIACWEWAEHLRRMGTLVRIPGIVNYECRRNLVYLNLTKGIDRLDEILHIFGCLQISDQVLVQAAHLWAKMRTLGKIATDDKLNADVIIAAEAMLFAMNEDVAVTIATDNTKHFAPLVDHKFLVGAAPWGEIPP